MPGPGLSSIKRRTNKTQSKPFVGCFIRRRTEPGGSHLLGLPAAFQRPVAVTTRCRRMGGISRSDRIGRFLLIGGRCPAASGAPEQMGRLSRKTTPRPSPPPNCVAAGGQLGPMMRRHVHRSDAASAGRLIGADETTRSNAANWHNDGRSLLSPVGVRSRPSLG